MIACCHCGGGMRWVCACPVPRLCVVVAAGPRVLVVVCVCVLCMCASHVLGLTPAAWVGCVPRAPLHCVVVCRLPQSLRARVNLQCANAVDVLRSLDKSACAARVLCASVHAPPFPVFRPGTGGDAAPRLTVVLWSFDQAPPTATHFSEPPHSVVSRTPADNSWCSHQSPCCRASTSYTSLRAPTLGRVANAC